MNLIDVHKSICAAEIQQFCKSIEVWNKRPNLINKRVTGVEILANVKLKNINYLDKVLIHLRNVKDCSSFSKQNIDETLGVLKEYFDFSTDISNRTVELFIKRLLPKSSKLEPEVEVSIYDTGNCSATFVKVLSVNSITSLSPEYIYQIKYDNKVISLLIEEDAIKSSKNIDWLKYTLIPKLTKWAENSNEEQAFSGSLRLVQIDEYYCLYNKLKDKYGKKFVEIWPEVTDPLKFVYEDLAIASYLILLWEGKKQRFIDLGCGNGLLVHILVSEGHEGTGIDVAERKIWKLYPPATKLIVHTITPSEDNVFPEADWLIGNHSDELTLWLPVIAARSSYFCKFFLLPCCSYELNGKKYQRVNSVKSQYMDYLDYIIRWCEVCGFSTEMDKLRIPSTKRLCIIGNSRKYLENNYAEHLQKIHQLVNEKCTDRNRAIINGVHDGYNDFKTRSTEIKVRNCTQLDRNLISDLVSLIAKKILSKSVSDNDKPSVWSSGNSILLSDLVRSLPKEHLGQLKKENGGLQTLIKNHRHIFKIENGSVSFRKPTKCSDSKKKSFKTKPCWFFYNHPDSCPLDNDSCSFIH